MRQTGGTLNVVFHGTFILKRDTTRHRIDALVPDIMSHEYLAGTYCKERPMAKGAVYELAGVTASSSVPQVHEETSLHFTGELVDNYADRLFCSWRLPAPQSILEVRRIAVNSDYFSGKDRQQVADLKELALVHVLQYPFAELGLLKIRNTTGSASSEWEPAFQVSETTVNLHVFASPSRLMPGMTVNDHVMMSFDAMTGLLKGADLGFRYPRNAPLAPSLSNIEGLPESELLNLAERNCKGPTPFINHTANCSGAVVSPCPNPAAPNCPHFGHPLPR